MTRYAGCIAALFTVALALFGCQPSEVKTPEGIALANDTVLEPLSATRGRIWLNGQWGFEPAINPEQPVPAGNWGTIMVPGSWTREGPHAAPVPGVLESHEAWAEAFDGKKVKRAWYIREFEVPTNWAGRAIMLDVRRLSTDAVVYVNGRNAGQLFWPEGEVELTGARVGMNSLVIDVLAEQTADVVMRHMGSGESQRGVAEATIDDKGLIGEVNIYSRPKGPHISDVFVMTSTRKDAVTLDVEFTGVKQASEVELTARMLDGRKVEQSFESPAKLVAAERQRVQVTFSWDDPRLWEIGDPQMYTLLLEAEGPGVKDEYHQPFGFREFWIEGRHYMLNGKPLKVRLTQAFSPWGSKVAGNVTVIDAAIDGAEKSGYNVMEHWPTDDFERGKVVFRDLWYDRTDQKGMGTFGVIKHVGPAIQDPKTGDIIWDDPEVQKRFAQAVQRQLRRVRNHPSVLMWGSAGNFFGGHGDQDPRLLGTKWAGVDKDNERHRAGEEAFEILAKLDPTRPIATHSGAVGAIHSNNHYLNFIPLQEREEWLSHYVEHGEMPYSAVEFGTPLYFTYSRGRNGFGALQAEPWLTEFAAIYLGPDAYAKETADYRDFVVKKYKGGDQWNGWFNAPEMSKNVISWEIQDLFMTNTWRSWRALGANGGMIAWQPREMLWKNVPTGPLAFEEVQWVPGQRGTYTPRLPTSSLYPLSSKHGFDAGRAGEALLENNQATLAWIAGSEAALTEKDSRFWPGQQIDKNTVLHNDARRPQDFELRWAAKIGDKVVAEGELDGELKVSERRLVPVKFKAPKVQATKASGTIELSARIGEAKHQDTFEFRVFRERPEAKMSVALVDPVGVTRRMLDELGVKSQAWDSKSTDKLVVIGRGALSHGDEPAVALDELKSAVDSGARVLILGQHPEWLRSNWGFRVNQFPARRVFRADEDHPVVAGLDDTDLTNFAGESTLVEAKPKYPHNRIPPHGWHWGNRGAVSSAAIEKPHRSGWRPLLETEFDLQYSPLLELAYGSGHVTLAMLDLEERVDRDPAARLLAVQVLQHAASERAIQERSEAVYIGGEQGLKALEATGVNFKRAGYAPRGAQLVVVGEGAQLSEAAIERLAKQGSNVLVLRGDEAGKHFGVTLEMNEAFHGSSDIAKWPELAGITASDLRLKVDLEYPLIKDGAETTADGMFARRSFDKGVVLYAQIDPTVLPTRGKQYLRLTAWRQMRALSQVLANLGASFETDDRIFRVASGRRELAGTWKYAVTQSLDAAPSMRRRHQDSGPSGKAMALMRAGRQAKGMQDIKLPGMIPQFTKADGEAVFQTVVNIPKSWMGNDLVLKLGIIDDYDVTYVNGNRIGVTTTSGKTAANRRMYRVPAKHLQAGENVITVRVFDAYGEGGFMAEPEEFAALSVAGENLASFYSPDYKSDHALGDEPYRYYRW